VDISQAMVCGCRKEYEEGILFDECREMRGNLRPDRWLQLTCLWMRGCRCRRQWLVSRLEMELGQVTTAEADGNVRLGMSNIHFALLHKGGRNYIIIRYHVIRPRHEYQRQKPCLFSRYTPHYKGNRRNTHKCMGILIN